MAHLYRRGKKGTWYVKFYRDGKQVLRSLKTTNRRVARDLAIQLEAGAEPTPAAHGQPAPIPSQPSAKTAEAQPVPAPADGRLRLADVLTDFVDQMESNRTHKSFVNECSRLRTIFGDACPRLSRQLKPSKKRKKKAHRDHAIEVEYLDELTTAVINKHIQERIRRDGISPATVLRIREILHRLFTWASERYGFYPNGDPRFPNPAAAIKRPTLQAPMVRFLTLEDVEEQLEAFKDMPVIRTMVAVYIYAGLRRAEALWLTRGDIDLTRRLIYIRAKEVDGDYWQPKTKRNRAVPISSTLEKLLKSYRPRGEGPWYFPSSSGQRWDPDTFGHYLADLNKKRGLAWTCLDFRHTFGSQLAQRGVSLYKIAELMGNSPEICRRHYAAIRTEHLHKDVEFED